MFTPLRRSLVVGLLLLAGLTSVPGAPVAPVAADPPAVTIPPRAVSDGDVVTLTTSGFSSGVHGFVQCPTASIAAAAPGNLPEGCEIRHIGFGDVAASFDMLVNRELVFTTAAGRHEVVDCGEADGTCSVGVFLPGVPDGSGYAALPFAPPLVPQPARGLSDGTTLPVTAAEVPAGDWAVRQCTRAFVPPADDGAGAACGTDQPVTFGGGTVSGAVTVRDPLIAADGTEHACGSTGCVLVLRSTDGAWHGRARISFGPTSLTLTEGPLDPVAQVHVTIANAGGTTALLRQCAGPVSADTCDAPVSVELDSVGGADLWRPVAARPTSESGAPLDCLATPCSLVLLGGDGTVQATSPMTFRSPPALALTPMVGLLDGQPVAVEAAGFGSSTSYSVQQCLPGGRPSGEPWCADSSVIVQTSPEGAFSTSFPVSARMPGPSLRPVYCRTQCALAVWTPDGWVLAPFSMAEGTVDVTPTDGLADGASVDVVGREIQPTYEGVPIGPWQTGIAAVAQCAATTAASPSLATALDGCSAVGSLPVTVTGSTVDETLTVATTFTTFTGRTIDCAEPGSCVVGLYRFEEDGSSTFSGSPVTFA